MPEEDNANPPAETGGSKKSKWPLFVILVLILITVGLIVWMLANKGEEVVQQDATTTTQEVEKVVAESDEPVYDPQQYSWSTMNEDPYRDKVSYATSANLLSWTDTGKILAEHASVPDIVLKDGTLFVYFVDVTTDGYSEKLGLVKSTDNGKAWSNREFVKIKGLGQKAAVDPAPVLLDDGRIRLFYFDIAEMRKPESKGKMIKNKIYSAVSSDGINFVEEDGVRLEYEGIFDPTVVKVSDSLWRMYVGNHDGTKVYSATSTDGLSFAYEGVAYSGGAIPNVIFEDNIYYLFTGGVEIATSKDGKTFTKISSRFSVKDKLIADPGVVRLGANNYLMVYKTGEMKPPSQPRQPR